MAYNYEITTREAKGSALTHNEIDSNFLASEERATAAWTADSEL